MDKQKLALVVFVLCIGILLRLHNYDIYPQRGATSDEYSYSFLGVSLLTTGIPVSWSYFPAYEHLTHLTIRNLYLPIVYPYFDHPPFNGIVVGAWAILSGEDSFEKIQLRTIRIVPIVLSTISSLFVFLLGQRLYGFKTALWALLIYSTTTIFVIQGRVVLAENLLTTLLLVAIYIFSQFSKTMTTKKTLILGILAGLSFWTKELGIVTFASLLYLFAAEKIKRRYILAFIATSLVIILGYIVYGSYYDFDLFWKIVTAQAERNVGPETLLYILSSPIIVNKFYYDGWYFFGFIAFFIAFLSYRKHTLLLVPSGIYFLLLLFFLAQKGEMGWYLIPLFPFMALFSAKVLVECVREWGWGIFLLCIFVGLYCIEYIYKANFGLTPFQFRLMMIALFLPLALAVVFRKKGLYSLLSHFWFYLFIAFNIYLTYTYIHPA